MARYANGRVPDSALIWFESGGERFRSTPATVARWLALVAECEQLHHVTLVITSGANAYRDYGQQVAYRAEYTALGIPLRAALPGTSSHGGCYAGAYTRWVLEDSMALDVNNWQLIGWAEFSRLARKHGFATDVVLPHELWHIVDFDPWAPVTSIASLNATILEDDMPTAAEVVDGLLNHAAYDNGPTVSEVLKALFEGMFVGGTSMPAGKPITTLLGEAVTAATSAANATSPDAVRAAISAELNFPAYDDGPSISQFYKNLDTRQPAPTTGGGDPVVTALTPAMTEEQLVAAIRSMRFGAIS